MSRHRPAADPDSQHHLFRQAVEWLGGIRATATLIGMSERSVARLYSGAFPLHDGHLRDICARLLERSTAMRELERQLTPAFSGNLTERQANPDPRGKGSRFDSPARTTDPEEPAATEPDTAPAEGPQARPRARSGATAGSNRREENR